MFVSIRHFSALKVRIGNEEIEHLSSHYWVNENVVCSFDTIVFNGERVVFSFDMLSLIADCARMIDIDHETKSAFSENLSIPGDEAILLEPNMDQIDSKLTAPNLTGRFK
jgi:hypothetical protein